MNLMTRSNRLAAINLNGDYTRRLVTLEVPKDSVRAFLPPGLELGPQNLTVIPGTHPVFLFFNDIFRLQLSIPTLIPNMTYHELHIGIPYTYLSTGPVTTGAPGPYYFMQRLYLDNVLAIFGGIVFWGFAKEMARFCVTANSYTVTGLTGHRVASLTWAPQEHGFLPVVEYTEFALIQQALEQTLVSQVPASVGPFFALSDFDLEWDAPGAGLRPLLEPSLEGDWEYVPGNAGRRVPATGTPRVPDILPLGSWELRVPWRLSLPYPPPHSFRR
jgi:hypothetical protein